MSNGGLEKAYQTLKLANGASIDEVKRAYTDIIRTRETTIGDWGRAKEIDWAYRALCEHLSSDGERSQETVPNKRIASINDPELCEGFSLKGLLFPATEDMASHVFWGKIIFLLVLIVWGLIFIFSPIEGDAIGRSFMHLINLPFHEAGHILFSFLGDFMRVLGGTLTQILIPLVCVGVFVRQRDIFGASCGLWWTGQSFIDAAPYIYDARAGELMLLGGVTGQDAPEYHDWHNMLDRLSMLSYDHGIAYTSKTLGIILIIASWLWAGWFLFSYYSNRGKT
jgi:hypothetical protein